MKSFLIFIFLYTAIRVHSCQNQLEIADSADVHPWSAPKYKDQDYSKIIIYIPKVDEVQAFPDEFPLFDKIQKHLFSFFNKITKPRDEQQHGFEFEPLEETEQATPKCIDKIIQSLKMKSDESSHLPKTTICKLCSIVSKDRSPETKPNLIQVLQKLVPKEKEALQETSTVEENASLTNQAKEKNEGSVNFFKLYVDAEKETEKNTSGEDQDLAFGSDKKRSLPDKGQGVAKRNLPSTPRDASLVSDNNKTDETLKDAQPVIWIKHVKRELEEGTVEPSDKDAAKTDNALTDQNLKRQVQPKTSKNGQSTTAPPKKELEEEYDPGYPRFMRSLDKSLNGPHFLLNSGDTEPRITANKLSEAGHPQTILNKRIKRQNAPIEETAAPASSTNKPEEKPLEIDATTISSRAREEQSSHQPISEVVKEESEPVKLIENTNHANHEEAVSKLPHEVNTSTEVTEKNVKSIAEIKRIADHDNNFARFLHKQQARQVVKKNLEIEDGEIPVERGQRHVKNSDKDSVPNQSHSNALLLTITLPSFLVLGGLILVLCYVARTGGWLPRLFRTRANSRENPSTSHSPRN